MKIIKLENLVITSTYEIRLLLDYISYLTGALLHALCYVILPFLNPKEHLFNNVCVPGHIEKACRKKSYDYKDGAQTHTARGYENEPVTMMLR